MLAHPILDLLGATFLAAVAYYCRQIPSRLWALLIARFTVSVSIPRTHPLFTKIESWLATQDTREQNVFQLEVENSKPVFAVGVSACVVRFRGRRIIARRIKDDFALQGPYTVVRPETIVLSMRGKRIDLEQFIEHIAASGDPKRINVKYWSPNVWLQTSGGTPSRSMKSVVLPKLRNHDKSGVEIASVTGIVFETKQFFESKSWYEKRGVPHRACWLFEGHPGTGKTSAVISLASMFDCSIHVLNLMSLINDDSLVSAINQIPSRSIVLIEDIDRMSVALKKDSIESSDRRGITLSGFLNALDGVTAGSGYLVILTTNHVDRLDPALIRSGRVTCRWLFPLMSKNLVQEMAVRFFPDEPRALLDRQIDKYDGPDLSAADWQQVFMNCRNAPGEIFMQTQLLVARTREEREEHLGRLTTVS